MTSLTPRTYLEVGCGDGAVLNTASDTTLCTGIDPFPSCEKYLKENISYFFCTSDEYFDQLKSKRPKFDLVYLNGKPLIEYLLRDFINAEKHSDPNGHIIISGCLPDSEHISLRSFHNDVHAGDKWKVIPILQKYRPDLTLKIINSSPDGLLIISNLDPSNHSLNDNTLQILHEFLNKTYSDYKKLNISATDNIEAIQSTTWQKRKRASFHKRSLHFKHFKQLPLVRKILRKLGKKPSKTTHPCLKKEERTLAIKDESNSPALRIEDNPKMLGVLLCYNDCDILEDVILSLLENNHDLVVWDHGSTDKTAEILDKYNQHFIERHFLSREFDFYKLYPTVSQHLIDNLCNQYDWISWPDQDEILEGPNRSLPYHKHVKNVLDAGYTHVRFDMFNFWFTELDDQTITQPTNRLHHYSRFPEFPPLIRAWKADCTNIREFNHNSIEGRQYPDRFRLRHYPMRSYDQAIQRIIFDRSNLQRGNQNIHYNALARRLDRLIIDPTDLHFDNGIDDLHYSATANFASLYGLRK